MDNKTIEITRQNAVATIWLNRPEIHNALNITMITELTGAFTELGSDNSMRVIVLRGRGKSFCAGADLKWMKEAAKSSREENYNEALRLSECFHKIYSCPKPVITLIHGAATGGGCGLVAASDIAISADDAIFSLSEVRLGLVPSVISPYIIKRIGEFPARELMLTARRIFGREAAERGLVNRSCQVRELDQVMENVTEELLQGGPEAMVICKQLIFETCNRISTDDSVRYNAEIFAQIRTSQEGREGMTAFLEKRKPKWLGGG